MATDDKIRNALLVMVLDPKISLWLSENDPQALKQAETALGMIRNQCPLCEARVSMNPDGTYAPHNKFNGHPCDCVIKVQFVSAKEHDRILSAEKKKTK